MREWREWRCGGKPELQQRFPHVHPDSLAGRRWRELRDAGDVDALNRFERRLAVGAWYRQRGIQPWHDPGPLLYRTYRLADGTPVEEFSLSVLLDEEGP